MKKCDQKHWKVFNRFGISIPASGAYFLEIGACVSLKAATKVFLEVKKLLKLRLFDYFLNAKTEECDQEDWSEFDKIGIKNTCSSADHLEVSAPTSLIAATKAYLIGKKLWKLRFSGYISKPTPEECEQKNWSACK